MHESHHVRTEAAGALDAQAATTATAARGCQMLFVAVDPTQPGTAYAGIVDDVARAALVRERLRQWRAAGALVQRVPFAEGARMVEAWDPRCSSMSPGPLYPHT